MGKVKHHAIIVTLGPGSYYLKGEEFPEQVRQKAKELFGDIVSNTVTSHQEGYTSFFVGPDGSKEGWEDSAGFDEKRKEFLSWCDAQTDEDGHSFITYCEVAYGGDGQ